MKLCLIRSKNTNDQLVIIRNDQKNDFINDERNITGKSICRSIYELNLDAHEFYESQFDQGSHSSISYGGVALYDLYARQCKAKFVEVIATAHRLADFSNLNGSSTEVISDKQTIDVLRKALCFIGFDDRQVKFKVNWIVTIVILINSCALRFIAFLKTKLSLQELPKHYYRTFVSEEEPTLLITSPAANMDAFYNSYLNKISGMNIVMYGLGEFTNEPQIFKKVEVPINKHKFKGQFVRSTPNISGYIADILLINTKHSRLYRAIAIANFIFEEEKIDCLLSRQQVHVMDNYLSILAKQSRVPIIADVFEQVYYCDAAVIDAPYSLNPLMVKVLGEKPRVFREMNEFMKYRQHGFLNPDFEYLRNLLGICEKKMLIFYASDPGKNQCQRFQLETFLMQEFSKYKNIAIIVKTHHQDDGTVTLMSFKAAGSPCNTYLIGDFAMRNKLDNKYFKIFNNFNFNAAVDSCNGFLTSYSTSALQAVKLNIKTGILDFVNHKYLRDLVNLGGAHLIFDAKSLQDFVNLKENEIKNEALKHYGLLDRPSKLFDMGSELKKLLEKIR